MYWVDWDSEEENGKACAKHKRGRWEAICCTCNHLISSSLLWLTTPAHLSHGSSNVTASKEPFLIPQFLDKFLLCVKKERKKEKKQKTPKSKTTTKPPKPQNQNKQKIFISLKVVFLEKMWISHLRLAFKVWINFLFPRKLHNKNCNKLPQTLSLEAREIYSFTAL